MTTLVRSNDTSRKQRKRICIRFVRSVFVLQSWRLIVVFVLLLTTCCFCGRSKKSLLRTYKWYSSKTKTRIRVFSVKRFFFFTYVDLRNIFYTIVISTVYVYVRFQRTISTYDFNVRLYFSANSTKRTNSMEQQIKNKRTISTEQPKQ